VNVVHLNDAAFESNHQQPVVFGQFGALDLHLSLEVGKIVVLSCYVRLVVMRLHDLQRIRANTAAFSEAPHPDEAVNVQGEYLASLGVEEAPRQLTVLAGKHTGVEVSWVLVAALLLIIASCGLREASRSGGSS